MGLGVRLSCLGLLAIAFLAGACPALAGAQPDTGTKAVALDMDALYIALDYDAKADPRAVPVIQKFFDLHIPVIPLADGDVRDRFDPKLNVIYWNSKAALQAATDAGAPTGKYVSPALLLLDAINHAVAYSLSPSGYENLSASPVASFGDLEQKRAISELGAGMATGIAGADPILSFAAANGLGNAVAAARGEPVRTNNIVLLRDGKAVEGLTYMTTQDPTWHKN